MHDTPNMVLAAADSLAIPRQLFRQSGPNRWEGIFTAVLEKLTNRGETNKRRRWLWEDLVEPCASVAVSPGQLDRLLGRLGNENEEVFLLIEDDGADWQKVRSNHWVFEGRLASVIRILNELPPTEFYIVGKRIDWLVTLNHHDVLIGTGECAVKTLSNVDAA